MLPSWMPALNSTMTHPTPTIFAESFATFSDAIEKGAKPADVAADALDKHWRVIFNGDNYSAEWPIEAGKRGVHRQDSGVEAMAALSLPKNTALFERMNVMSVKESEARTLVNFDHYWGTVEMEALTMVDMMKQHVIPSVKNAGLDHLIPGLDAGVAKVEAGIASQDDPIRVMILAGEGKSFCAGMDLKAVQDDPILMGDMLRRLAAISRRIRRLEIPTISRVQGAAIGGGCGLMVVCDFSFTHPEAKVGYPEVDLGICPAVVAPFLVKRIGAGPARAMLLAGGTMSGQEGFDRGLATHLVAADELESATLALAGKLAKGGREAIAATKQWLNELDGSYDDEQLSKGAEISAELIQTEDAQNRLRTLFSR